MLKKSKILVLIATVLCGAIFVTFGALGIAELCNYNPLGKTYKVAVPVIEIDENNRSTVYHKFTFYSDSYEYESYSITFTDGDREVKELENTRGDYGITDNKITLSDNNEFEISGRTLIWGDLTLTRSGYWLMGIYWGVGFIALFAGVGAFCAYKYYVYKKTKNERREQDEE